MALDFSDPLTMIGTWSCRRIIKNVAILNCFGCKYYPCEQFTPEVEKALIDSPFTAVAKGSHLRPRRVKMFLFLMYDGTVAPAYEGFDLDNPDWEQLRDVQEVLQVSKAFTKQMKLVAKPKEERAAIREEINAARKSAEQPAAEEPQRRRKKK